ncbi:hypothetical protein D9619_004367 [Psilocybe cf. subviscida]|uniref:ZZ-type domain-containing protein n=1 Tax=Psilocybe cf. subviscida TaxID=2480587 RepID=A0A8H5BSH3_9AGAR|nr:hypothetical protein D9619_004367 [Psilocybe cf. subviscida]
MVAPSSPAFNCDSCQQLIAHHNPRGRCTICPDYDLCANCLLGERFTNGHTINHQMQVFKQSGGSGHPILPASGSTVPTPGVPPPAFPQDPLASARQPLPTMGWQPFFLNDMSPSPTFLTLMNDLFTYFDPANNGNLEPEALSRFLIDMGQPANEDAWTSGLQESFGCSKESNGDKALKNVFDLFSIEHVLLQRTRPVIKPAGGSGGGGLGFGRSLRNALSPQVSHQGPMPAITRKGFIEFFTINFLTEPSEQWACLSRALRKYQLPKYAGWGELPRSVLPAMPDPGMLRKVQSVQQYAQMQGQQALQAAQMGAMISAQANRAAVDAVGGTRTEYVYGY